MPYDVAIIGAGVVGCAMLRRFALQGARAVLLERGPDILSGASKANSAILHTGFDAPEGSLELACMQRGYDEFLSIQERFNLSRLETGALVVAWTPEQVEKLAAIEQQAWNNGVADVRMLDARAIREMEPELSHAALAGVHVPREHVIDPWSPSLAYVLQAQSLGASVVCSAEVTGGDFDGRNWHLLTTKGRYQARTVINCAGLFGDTVNRKLLGSCEFEIRPRKGQFVVFDKSAAKLLNAIILPVPTERTKGVVLTRTVFGNILVGPTAEEQEDRERANVDKHQLQTLVETGIRLLPNLARARVAAVYAGLRPATEAKEYRIRADHSRNWITVGGIRSTGMTAALGIAAHAYDLYSAAGCSHIPVENPPYPRVPNLAEHRPRDWQQPGYDEVICHCEMVTRREIEAAFSTTLPPGDFGGLKRRTRCGMGRCQGFHCNARLAALTKGRLSVGLDVGATS